MSWPWSACARLWCAAILSVGCGADADADAAPVKPASPEMPAGGLLDWDLEAFGPFGVGWRALTIDYDPPKGASGHREIVVNVWYPTLDTNGQSPVYLGVFPDDDVIADATLAPPVEPSGYPVHVYSHGYSGFGATSSDMMRWFASHGWIAVAPDHKGNTLQENSDKIPISIRYLRSMDVTASLDALEELPAADPLAGKARTDSVLLSGHSFGTFTTWASGGAVFDVAYFQAKCDAGDHFSEPCAPEDIAVFETSLGDPRVVAGIPMAGGDNSEPAWFGTDGYDPVAKPYLLMTGSDDPVGAENLWARVTAIDFTWLDFEGGCHQLFALGGCPQFDEREGWDLVNTYALAFGRRHVLDDASARTTSILDGSAVLSEKVVYQRKKGPG